MQYTGTTIGRIMLVGILIIFCAQPGRIGATEPDTSFLAHSNNTFAFDLLREVAAAPGNVFFSPYSISSALALAYAGAAGQTAAEMTQVLHFPSHSEDVHAAFSRLNSVLNTPQPGYRLTVANALWGQAGTAFHPSFLNTAEQYYDAALRTVDFSGQPAAARLNINHWVEQQTNGKIKDLIPHGVITPLTRLILTNAVYFQGDWEQAFDPRFTEIAPFYVTSTQQVSVPMMRREGRFLYTETATAQILQLPYRSGDLVMNILLPKPHILWEDFISELTVEWLCEQLTRLRHQTVNVRIPRFKLETSLSLRTILSRMGLTTAFDPQTADFSHLASERLYITDVVHKAYVDVNEEGTEAAAATGVVVGVTSLGPPPVVFRADRPFVFLIQDTRSGSVLFLGALHNPD